MGLLYRRRQTVEDRLQCFPSNGMISKFLKYYTISSGTGSNLLNEATMTRSTYRIWDLQVA